MNNVINLKSRIGEVFKSTRCGDFIVKDYESSYRVTIQFIQSGFTKVVSQKQIREGCIKDPSIASVYGWGINDVNYNVTKIDVLNNKPENFWMCPYYRKWVGVLKRCFDLKMHRRLPTYKDCTTCEDWRYFSNFIKWVDSQPNRNWEGCELDKDLLIEGNKHYSPETAVFIANTVNGFIIDSGNRGDCLLGVLYRPNKSSINPYYAQCSNPFTGKRGHLGVFPTELEAHKAWQTKKHEYACALADLQDDLRVADALRQRYSPDKDWTKQ